VGGGAGTGCQMRRGAPGHWRAPRPTTSSPVRATCLPVAVVATVAVSLTGCSGPQDVPGVGPADSYIDLVLDVSLEEAEQRQIRQEELLAACMAEAGFEYVPSLVNMVGFVDEAAIAPPRGSREFAEQYGYGLVSLPPGVQSPVIENPNDAIIAAMSEAEVVEYFRARDGAWGEGLDGATPEPGEGWKPEGCDVWARGQMAALAADQDDTYSALKAEVDRIDADVVPAHPDVVAVDAAWAECMADAGFPGYSRQPEAQERERERFDAPDIANGAIGPDGMTDGQRQELPHERALATADWDCTDRVGYSDVVARVRNAAQQEYVDAHRDELDAWVETYFGAARANS